MKVFLTLVIAVLLHGCCEEAPTTRRGVARANAEAICEAVVRCDPSIEYGDCAAIVEANICNAAGCSGTIDLDDDCTYFDCLDAYRSLSCDDLARGRDPDECLDVM
jgi:hypothetical protein